MAAAKAAEAIFQGTKHPLAMKFSTHLLLPALLFPLLNGARGQFSVLDLPRDSQRGMVLQRVGTTDLTVDWSRPSVKGRTIWGQLVPYGKVWRAGANENTVFTTSDPVKVEGQDLPAGSYGVHMIPTEGAWTVIFSKDHSAWGSFFYKEGMDQLRVQVTPRSAPATEHLTYLFTDITANAATLALRWAELEVPIALSVDVHQLVLDGMAEQLRGQTAFGWEAWYEAALYADQERIAPEKAMAWVDMSIARGPNMENQALKANMLEERGSKAEADALRGTMLEGASNPQLNTYGYTLINQGKTAEGVKVFELNAKLHADDPNVHDSLGEGYMKAGRKADAVKSFKKSLSMSPPDGVRANSIKCLKELGVDTAPYEKP
jgi:hypothetical protein